MPVTAYSTTAANNNGAVPNGAPEGMAPSGVNDVIRQVMADIAVEAQTNNVKVLKSVAGTNTITADMDPELAAYVAGMIVVFTPANTNTGATTIAIDGLTALDIQKGSGSALSGGELVAGIPVVLVLDSGADDFIIVGHQESSGSFTATLTGMTSATTATVSYKKIGSWVTLWGASGTAFFGTSNSNSLTMTGLPSAITPTGSGGAKYFPMTGLMDNANSFLTGTVQTTGGSSTLGFSVASANLSTGVVSASSVFTSSSNKGLSINWTISYNMDT